MDQIIKTIRDELKPIKKEYNLRLRRVNNQHQEILEYTNFYGLNFRKHNLTCKFIYQKQENSISLVYSFICTKKNCDTYKEVSFLKDLEDYPCFSKEDVEEIKALYKFETFDNIIKNTVSLEEQSTVLIKLFKKNYNNLSDYVKNQTNNTKAPE